jgi:hypothetical protein
LIFPRLSLKEKTPEAIRSRGLFMKEGFELNADRNTREGLVGAVLKAPGGAYIIVLLIQAKEVAAIHEEMHEGKNGHPELN